MTDKNTLDLARQWAADIDADRQTLSQDTIDAAADLISSLPDAWVDADKLRRYIADWREGLATAPRGNYEAEMLDDLEFLLPAPPAPESAAPRPEDVPVGEAWQVEADGQEVIGYRNDPNSMLCWTVVCRDNSDHDWMFDYEITLIARLVPETTEQDLPAEHGPYTRIEDTK